MTIPDLMHATQVARPFHTKGWVYEEKIDGWRMLALKEAGRVRLVSRNGRDHSKRFRHIIDALTALKPVTFTPDGEVAVFDAELVSRLEWLRRLNHGDLATPPLFVAFDLLRLESKDYRAEPAQGSQEGPREARWLLGKDTPAASPSFFTTHTLPIGVSSVTDILHRCAHLPAGAPSPRVLSVPANRDACGEARRG